MSNIMIKGTMHETRGDSTSPGRSLNYETRRRELVRIAQENTVGWCAILRARDRLDKNHNLAVFLSPCRAQALLARLAEQKSVYNRTSLLQQTGELEAASSSLSHFPTLHKKKAHRRSRAQTCAPRKHRKRRRSRNSATKSSTVKSTPSLAFRVRDGSGVVSQHSPRAGFSPTAHARPASAARKRQAKRERRHKTATHAGRTPSPTSRRSPARRSPLVPVKVRWARISVAAAAMPACACASAHQCAMRAVCHQWLI